MTEELRSSERNAVVQELTTPTFSMSNFVSDLWSGCSTRRQSPELAKRPIENDCNLDLKTLYQKASKSAVQIWGDKGVGSGFFACVDNECFFVTNHHVAGNKGQHVTVVDPALRHDFDKDISAFVSASDVANDISIIYSGRQQSQSSLQPVEFAKDTKVGDSYFQIGHPQGIEAQVISPGTISKDVKREFFGSNESDHGDSGSPWFNSRGQAIAILTSKIEPFNTSNTSWFDRMLPTSPYSFATKIDRVENLINQFLAEKKKAETPE